MRTTDEMEDMLDKTGPYLDHGVTAVSGMSYEEGVSAALNWVLGNTDDEPIEEEFDETSLDNEDEDEEDAVELPETD